MPTPTYDLIEEKVLSSAQASVTFSSIPGTYKDLVVEIVFTQTAGNNSIRYRCNSDTGTNYSTTAVSGDGSTASSQRESNGTSGFDQAQGSSTTLAIVTFNFMSYANTTTYKTVVSRGSSSSQNLAASVSLWRSTNAITSLSFAAGSSFPTNNLSSGSTFRLWGVSG